MMFIILLKINLSNRSRYVNNRTVAESTPERNTKMIVTIERTYGFTCRLVKACFRAEAETPVPYRTMNPYRTDRPRLSTL